MGTNTLDIEVRPHRDGVRTSTMDANAQTSIPIVDVMLPSGGGDHLAIPQVNLSILGYEPDSLRNSHIRSPSMCSPGNFDYAAVGWTDISSNERPCWKKNTGIPQVSGMRIFPWRYICARSLHAKKEGISRRKVMMMIIEGHIEIGDPLREGDIQIKVEDPLTEEDTLIEDLLEEVTP